MNQFNALEQLGSEPKSALLESSCRESLRSATQGPHERLHLHAGFAAVKDGTISISDYRALLMRLYGFYEPFERAIGADPVRTQWLMADLASLGTEVATFDHNRFCRDFPRYDNPARRLGARYVVEGSALGGRQLYRGLDSLFGKQANGGRSFFAGHGTDTGKAWNCFLGQLESVGPEPSARAEVIDAAVETFVIFEAWLSGWSNTK
jgi:heme oxygenase